MNEQLVNDLKEYLSDDAEPDGMISLSVKRAIRSFKKKRNYPSGYTDEKINGRTDKRKTVTFGKEK